VLLGGRSAEELVLETFTTGAGNDLERATELARKMVCEWGMSEALGPLTFGKGDEQIFLGREIAQHRDYSEETARAIDHEVKRLVTEAHQTARNTLQQRLDTLHELAKALLEEETLDAEAVNAIVSGRPRTPKPPEKAPAPAGPDAPPAPPATSAPPEGGGAEAGD
jgi:cell division protease FtsH